MQNADFGKIIDFIVSISLWDIVKIFYLIILFFYIFFSVIVLRQISLMTQTLTAQLEKALKFFGVFNLLLAIFLFLSALSIL